MYFGSLAVAAEDADPGKTLSPEVAHLTVPDMTAAMFYGAAGKLDRSEQHEAFGLFHSRSYLIADAVSAGTDTVQAPDDRAALLCAARAIEQRGAEMMPFAPRDGGRVLAPRSMGCTSEQVGAWTTGLWVRDRKRLDILDWTGQVLLGRRVFEEHQQRRGARRTPHLRRRRCGDYSPCSNRSASFKSASREGQRADLKNWPVMGRVRARSRPPLATATALSAAN